MSDAGSRADPPSLAGGRSPAETPAIGQRLVVRVRTGRVAASGNPQLTDHVGVLEQVLPESGDQPQRWLLRHRNGTMIEVDPSTASAVRVLPEPPSPRQHAAAISVAELEEVAAQGWQPLESVTVGRWRLRAAQGFTGRANSVLPLGDPDQPLDDALARVQQWYAARGLPPQFQVPLPWRGDLDRELAGRGWTARNSTHVLVADIASTLVQFPPRADLPTVQWSTRPSQAWLAAYSYRGQPLPAIAATVMTNAAEPVFASVVDPAAPHGPLLAVGRSALAAGWVGITALDVAENARRRGLGSHVTRALLDHGHSRGCRHAYLQVADENRAARELYARLGFTEHHTYHYRVGSTS